MTGTVLHALDELFVIIKQELSGIILLLQLGS